VCNSPQTDVHKECSMESREATSLLGGEIAHGAMRRGGLPGAVWVKHLSAINLLV
jgi:hypothetical protein